MSKAYDLGYEDYVKLLTRDQNPYPVDSDEADEWDNGWDKADSDWDAE